MLRVADSCLNLMEGKQSQDLKFPLNGVNAAVLFVNRFFAYSIKKFGKSTRKL